MSSYGRRGSALPGRSSTCRGVTKQGAPCSISYGLTPDGFCKFHASNSRQCLGTSRASGQRCRIKWDLGASGDCVHHHSQPAASSAVPSACRGLTKRRILCSVTWGLDANGFCKYHAPNACQCKGLARATGRRCKIKWGLGDGGYCQFHRRVDAPATRQCEAVVPATGRRCSQTVGIDAAGFCTAHRAVNAELPLCRGLLPGSNECCGNNAKVGYDYCCAAHDPKFATSYVAPNLFNDPGLRSSVEGDIVKLFKSRDLYHGDKLDLNTVGAVELDHILEKQCFAYAFQRVEFRDGEEEAQDVVFLLREEIVNELPNLCLACATTNKMKGAAVSRFLNDSLTGHRGSKTFTDNLLAEKRDDTQLARDVTRTIRSEMGLALRRCQRKLADVGEMLALEALSAELQQLYVDMELHTCHSGKTKPRAVVSVASDDGGDKDDDYVLVDSASDSWTVIDIKQSVKVEARYPTLSADAKPYVAIRLEDSKVASRTIEDCKLELDEVEIKTGGAGASIDSASKVSRAKSVRQKVTSKHPESKKKATSKQVSSESTCEVVVKEEEMMVKGAKWSR